MPVVSSPAAVAVCVPVYLNLVTATDTPAVSVYVPLAHTPLWSYTYVPPYVTSFVAELVPS